MRARITHLWRACTCVLLMVCNCVPVVTATVAVTTASPVSQIYAAGSESSNFTDIAPAPASFVLSLDTDCERHVLSLLGWQQAYDPQGYNLAEDLPSNCSVGTWQSLGCLKALKKLSLTGSLSNLPESWATTGSFPALEILNLSSAKLGGSLPSSWAQLSAFPRLKSMYLGYTQLTGTLPSAWAQPGAFTALEDLDLSYTLLSGTALLYHACYHLVALHT